jgi:hypothetical protein
MSTFFQSRFIEYQNLSASFTDNTTNFVAYTVPSGRVAAIYVRGTTTSNNQFAPVTFNLINPNISISSLGSRFSGGASFDQAAFKGTPRKNPGSFSTQPTSGVEFTNSFASMNDPYNLYLPNPENSDINLIDQGTQFRASIGNVSGGTVTITLNFVVALYQR